MLCLELEVLSSMATKAQHRLVRKTLVEGIRRNGERIFDISQRNAEGFVPVDRGILRQSGYVRNIRKGVIIGYKASHSARVEFGQPEFHYTGSKTVTIKKHTIHTKYGPRTIKTHDRIYVNKRVVRIRPRAGWNKEMIEKAYGVRIPGNVSRMTVYGTPIFVVMSRIPARPGQFFLTRAVLEGIKKLPEDMKQSLKRIGTVK